jgi:NAD(P)H-hydrate epimerase
MVLTDPDENILSHLPDISRFTSIGVGPGIGTDKRTVSLLNALFDYASFPIVIDADALNILSVHKDLLNLIPANSILTPHPGEFKRLVGAWRNDFERLELQRSLSSRLKSIVILKGAFTSIALPSDEVYFNSTGNPAMATGGSGDVLTGVITALLAQKYSPTDAAVLGVYLHGMAGDLAAVNRQTIMASDIINQIPIALKQLTSS